MRGLMGCKLRETGPSAGLMFSWNYGLFCILVIIHISWLALVMGKTVPSWSLYIIPWDFNTWGHWDPPLASLPLPWWKTGPKMLFCNKLQRMLAKVRNFERGNETHSKDLSIWDPYPFLKSLWSMLYVGKKTSTQTEFEKKILTIKSEKSAIEPVVAFWIV